MSKIAGIDLVPVMDWEIAHINIAVKSEEEKAKELEIVHRNADEGVADCALEEDDKPVVDWHTDSYPFVCVTMLSDCTTMVGGETMLRKGNGGTVKVRGPQMVCLSEIILPYGHHTNVDRVLLSSFKVVTSSIKPFVH